MVISHGRIREKSPTKQRQANQILLGKLGDSHHIGTTKGLRFDTFRGFDLKWSPGRCKSRCIFGCQIAKTPINTPLKIKGLEHHLPFRMGDLYVPC